MFYLMYSYAIFPFFLGIVEINLNLNIIEIFMKIQTFDVYFFPCM